jgi:hypothetical protein
MEMELLWEFQVTILEIMLSGSTIVMMTLSEWLYLSPQMKPPLRSRMSPSSITGISQGIVDLTQGRPRWKQQRRLSLCWSPEVLDPKQKYGVFGIG